MKGKLSITNISTEKISDRIIDASLDEWAVLTDIVERLERIEREVSKERPIVYLNETEPEPIKKLGIFRRFWIWLFGE